MFLHIDCVRMTPREGIALACTEALRQGLPDVMRDSDVISIPKSPAKGRMVCNNPVLDDRTVAVPSEEPLDKVAAALKVRGFDVMRLPYRVPCMIGGSFRCAHQPLTRR